MKKFIFCSILAALSLLGCEKPQPEPEIVELKIKEVYLSVYTVHGGAARKIPILSGNGGYYIVYPEKINVHLLSGGSGSFETDFSEDFYKVYINDDNEIVIEAGPLMDTVYGAATCEIYLKDKKGQSLSFTVGYGFWA